MGFGGEEKMMMRPCWVVQEGQDRTTKKVQSGGPKKQLCQKTIYRKYVPCDLPKFTHIDRLTVPQPRKTLNIDYIKLGYTQLNTCTWIS